LFAASVGTLRNSMIYAEPANLTWPGAKEAR